MPVDPLTATLLITQMTGFGLQAAGKISESRAQSQAALRNSAIARQQAEQIKSVSEFETKRLRKQKRSFEGTQRALFAKSGVKSQGSPLEVIADSASEFELDIQISRFNAEMQQRRVISAANEDVRKARRIRSAGRIGAFSTLLQSAGSLANFSGTGTQGPGTQINTTSGVGVRGL